jgi:hypothetical protein
MRTPTLWRAALLVGVAAVGAPGARAQTPPCAFRGAPSALAERPSPLDSVMVRLDGGEAKLCYGRPASGGSPRIGADIPYGSPWQMGANEPTTLHLPFRARLGTVDLVHGSYSLYAIPEAGEWTIVVNGNPDRWGVPIGAEVRAADIGSFRAATTQLPEHVDRLTFRFDGASPNAGALVYEWEWTRLSLPLTRR